MPSAYAAQRLAALARIECQTANDLGVIRRPPPVMKATDGRREQPDGLALLPYFATIIGVKRQNRKMAMIEGWRESGFHKASSRVGDDLEAGQAARSRQRAEEMRPYQRNDKELQGQQRTVPQKRQIADDDLEIEITA